MNAKDRTEDVLKSIHILFSKAEPIENSKKKVIIDKDRMMNLLKELNDCMYAMMDEYEISRQSKEKALREIQKKSDEIVFESRKDADDIYAASIMYTDHTLDELLSIIEKTKTNLDDIHTKMNEQIETNKQMLKDNQIDLKNRLSALVDTQKYLMLIENENKRLQREAEKAEENKDWSEPAVEKVVPEIKINEEYFKQAGLLEEAEDDDLPDLEGIIEDGYSDIEITGDDFDEVEPGVLKGIFGIGRKKE